MIRESRAVWGIAAPVSLFGAQIQTESAWRPSAHSIYAAGLSQFIPSTAAAMSRKYPELGDAEPLNPQWAIRALVRYNHDIYTGRFVNAVQPATDCDKWAFALSGYNGGEGWIPRDRALCRQEPDCDASRWYGHVEHYTGRSAANARQNREYPRRIELQYQPAYRSWGGFVQCSVQP
jgi:soluble lytic murein transglycosylase-like protein